MTEDIPEVAVSEYREKLTSYLEEVADYANEGLNKLSRGEYPSEEIEAISELAEINGDPMWGVKPPYDSGYLPEGVQESVESIDQGLEDGEELNLDRELESISNRLSEEIERHSR